MVEIDDVGCTPTLEAGRPAIALFRSPFEGDFPLGSYFDHDLPFRFQDSNGFHLTFCGSRVTPSTDGHSGFDWRMPNGTPLFAVADGEVVLAGEGETSFCPPLGQVVTGLLVALRHDAPAGEVFITAYDHMDRVDVEAGQMIDAGTRLGLSGNTGCSTEPHLHFETLREIGTRTVSVDPYGWQGDGDDPWAQHPQGAASIWLWQEGEAPALAR